MSCPSLVAEDAVIPTAPATPGRRQRAPDIRHQQGLPTPAHDAARPGAIGTPPPLQTFLDIGRSRGINWTELRREVLTILWRTDEPWAVYALADAMRVGGRVVFPNSLYRVLNLLEQAGLIVSIASSRRFQISPNPDQGDWAVLQCTLCEHQSLVRLNSAAATVRDAAHDLGHATDRLIIECVGRCRSCTGVSSTGPASKAHSQGNSMKGHVHVREGA